MTAFEGKNGFTFVEILVVIAVMSIIATISAVTFQKFYHSSARTVAAQEIYMALRDARNNTLASEGDTVVGVHMSTSSVTRFTGSTYNPSDATNRTYSFIGGTIATGTLVTSGADIVFTRLTGTPSATGTVYVLDGEGTATSTIVIYASGLIEY